MMPTMLLFSFAARCAVECMRSLDEPVSFRDHQSGYQPDMTMAWEDSISETL
jgi:hypothetical protein